MTVAASLGPNRNNPHFSSLTYPLMAPTQKVLTTAGGVQTMLAAEALCGLLLCDCQDAQTYTLPSATVLNAAIPGVQVGTTFDLDIVNYGDTTLTIGLGTGVTKITIASVAPVLTLATLVSKRLRLVCTGVATPSGGTDAWVVYGFGSTAAAVA